MLAVLAEKSAQNNALTSPIQYSGSFTAGGGGAMTVGKYVCCSKNNSKEYCIQHFPILFSTHSLTLFLLHTLTLSGEFDPNASTNAACYGDIAGDGGEGIDKSVEFGFDF